MWGWPDESVVWTAQHKHVDHFFGRKQTQLANIRSCEGGTDDNQITFTDLEGERRENLRVTGQGGLIYALNHESQNIETHSIQDCPPSDAESEFDYQEIHDKPRGQEPNGISTDDGLVMYFSFLRGEIRHISKLFPALVGNEHTIRIRENTKGVNDPRESKAGQPFRVSSEQVIGKYSWHLQNQLDSSQSTPCGETPDLKNLSDATSFDCRYSGSSSSPPAGYQRGQVAGLRGAGILQVHPPGQGRGRRHSDHQHHRGAGEHRREARHGKQANPIGGGTAVSQHRLGPGDPAVHERRPHQGEDQITSYVIEYTPQGREPQTEEVPGGSVSSHVLGSLRTNTKYSIRVSAVNGHGQAGRGPPQHRQNSGESRADAGHHQLLHRGKQPHGRAQPGGGHDPHRQRPRHWRRQHTGYEITQISKDREAFRLTPSSDGTEAKLSLVDVPDFEAQESYSITVRTTSGIGLREEYTDQEVTVSVTNVLEPPATPAVPIISHHRQRHLRVSWNPPDNTGPAITDYDVQYRVVDITNPDPPWTDRTFEGTATTANLSELLRDTPYQARVRAHNHEGTSAWSLSGEGSTLANIPPALPDTDQERSAPENSPMDTPVGDPVAATDEDIHDEGQLEYSLEGPDAADFKINQDTGQILVLSPLDHETKSQYEVTIKVIDYQTGSDTVTVNIEVTDREEKPDTPEAPSVSEGKYANTLAVSWEEPTNTGPDISDYDLRYREGSSGDWSHWDHEGTDRNSIITNLPHSTTHQVRVRAYNNERWSDWSPSGTGRTADNDSPRFPDGEETTRSITETLGDQKETTARSVGAAVTAQDTDSGDQVSYTLTGTDDSKFSINSSTGQISTKTGD